MNSTVLLTLILLLSAIVAAASVVYFYVITGDLIPLVLVFAADIAILVYITVVNPPTPPWNLGFSSPRVGTDEYNVNTKKTDDQTTRVVTSCKTPVAYYLLM